MVRPGVQHWNLILQSLCLAATGNGRAEIEPGDTVSITEKLGVHIDASEQEPRFHHISYTSLWFWRLPFGIGEKFILSCTCHPYNPFCPSEPAVVPTADWTTNAKGKHFLGRENSLWEVPEVTFSRNWEKGGMERKRESTSWQKKEKGVCTAGLNHVQSCSPITWHPLKLFSLNIYSTFAYMRGWALPGKRAEEEAVLIYFTILI